jgi:ATP-dependent DNA helicase Rep
VKLFDEHPEVRERWQNKLRYLLVDEYQDTNRAQYRLLKLLAGVRGAFTAVGDDDQAIYAWRGADIENLRQLPVDYPSLQGHQARAELPLHHAHPQRRQHGDRQQRKALRQEAVVRARRRRAGDRGGLPDPEHEAESVVMKLSAHKFEHRTHFKDYAILYRGNHQARLFEQQLRNHKIPYAISGGRSFFENAEIKDLCSYLRLIANEDDDLAFIRAITVPRRGIGAATIESLGHYAATATSACSPRSSRKARPSTWPRASSNPARVLPLHQPHRPPRPAEPAGQVINDLLKAINYEAWLYESCEPREAETKWSNVGDFTGWLGRKGEEDGKTLST